MDKITIDIIKGCEGLSVYINDYRVAGNKPWGGGTVIQTFTANKKDILMALGIKE